MAKITTKDIKHVAELSNLKLTPKEEEKYSSQLEKIISYIEELNEVKTKNVEPTSQTTGLLNIKRKDEVKSEDVLSQKQALSGTEKTNNGYFVIPGIFEEKT